MIMMNEVDINRKRDLEFRANELGVSIGEREDLDVAAVKLSRIIEELDND